MFAQIINGQIVAITKGSIDPVHTRRVCEPFDKASPERKELVAKRKVTTDIRAELSQIKKQGLRVANNRVLKKVPKIQRKLMKPYVKPYQDCKQRLKVAQGESAKAAAAYKIRRRELYAEHAVYLAPGGCVPVDEKTVERFKNLKPGQVLVHGGKVKNVS